MGLVFLGLGGFRRPPGGSKPFEKKTSPLGVHRWVGFDPHLGEAGEELLRLETASPKKGGVGGWPFSLCETTSY